MRYLILATDYDGTLARIGHVEPPVWEAIRRFRESGRKAIMVTGRELEDLQAICPHLDLFERVVAENGALIFRPATKEVQTLAEPPPPEFAARLKALGVAPISAGHVIVATVKPYETAVLKTINELGLELQVIFNQESVMVLPSGVNKATGLVAALKEMGYSPHNAVAIGDAENDHALLSICECGAAVGNGVPALKERADLVTRGGEGTAVIELIDRVLADDLESASARLARHHIVLGTTPDGRDERIPPYGKNFLVAGTSGSGKAMVMAGLLERLADAKYQFVLIDPEGRYPQIPASVVLGSAHQAPVMEELASLVAGGRNAVINLSALPLADRPGFFDQLFARLTDMRARSGRPHWIVIDEAHHLTPTNWANDNVPARLHDVSLVTVHPGRVSPAMLQAVDLVLAVGQEPAKTLSEFFAAAGIAASTPEPVPLAPGEALAYWAKERRGPYKLVPTPPRGERHRLRKKLIEGRLPDERVFIFRGPERKLNLRAYNLTIFLELGAGVDDATWLHHLKAGEYSRWFRDAIHDDELARQIQAIETRTATDSAASREAVRKAVEQRYSLALPPRSDEAQL